MISTIHGNVPNVSGVSNISKDGLSDLEQVYLKSIKDDPALPEGVFDKMMMDIKTLNKQFKCK